MLGDGVIKEVKVTFPALLNLKVARLDKELNGLGIQR